MVEASARTFAGGDTSAELGPTSVRISGGPQRIASFNNLVRLGEEFGWYHEAYRLCCLQIDH
jgi:hypothetical protein